MEIHNNNNNAIFGYTGFVGKNLLLKYAFKFLYNSKNIKDAMNKEFDTVFITCIPAVKWLANKNPEQDNITINEIKKVIRTIQAKKIILISTIDVYDKINNKSNENTTINEMLNHVYGRNRYDFEKFIKLNFLNYHIIRLPALFGRGLKKNIIYDLLNNNNVSNIYINSFFQWYNLENIKLDIEICINNKIKECNLFTEPLETSKIIELFPEYNYDNNPKELFKYDLETIYFDYFPNGIKSKDNCNCGYIQSKEYVLQNLVKFINSYKNFNKNKYHLCVSNISNNSLKNEQYYSVLNMFDIKYLEIAPTKIDSWNNLLSEELNNDIFNIECEKTDYYNLKIVSFQSITFTITNNIFDINNEELMIHLKKVIDFACKKDINNLVFGCPKNRRILDNNIETNENKFIKFMTELGDYINNRNLIISIENNSKKYDCNFLNTIKEVGDIVLKINHPKIKMMIDIGNCIMDHDDFEYINFNFYKNIINHIHISMPYMNPLFYINNKYIQFIKILKDINYQNIISLEFLNNQYNDSSKELKLLNKSLSNFLELCQ